MIAKLHPYIRLWTTLGGRWAVETYVRALHDAEKGKKIVHEVCMHLIVTSCSDEF